VAARVWVRQHGWLGIDDRAARRLAYTSSPFVRASPATSCHISASTASPRRLCRAVVYAAPRVRPDGRAPYLLLPPHSIAIYLSPSRFLLLTRHASQNLTRRDTRVITRPRFALLFIPLLAAVYSNINKPPTPTAWRKKNTPQTRACGGFAEEQ